MLCLSPVYTVVVDKTGINYCKRLYAHILFIPMQRKFMRNPHIHGNIVVWVIQKLIVGNKDRDWVARHETGISQ